MEHVAAVLVAYLIGSIPFAFLLSRQRGIDLRESGSHNVGAANVLRTTGVRAALLAMALDALKGTLAVLVAQRLAAGPITYVAAGLVSMIGHIYPVWLRFRGGKGVATAAGVFAVLTPLALGAGVAVFLAAVVATRYISVGSMAGAITLATVALVGETPAIVGAGAALSAVLIIISHRGNLARLRAGTERRISRKRRGSDVR